MAFCLCKRIRHKKQDQCNDIAPTLCGNTFFTSAYVYMSIYVLWKIFLFSAEFDVERKHRQILK